MNVTGEPVYKGAFIRGIHEAEAEYDARLTLELALDFGKHHPCFIARQVSVVGQVRYLGGILGQQLYLDDFCDILLRYVQNWFPNANIKWCCDPAFVVSSSDRWLRISEQSTVVDRFLADGYEAGYVWDEHLVSVNNKQVRKPKKDGWYEHGQNCAEYLELNFGMAAPKVKKPPAGSGYRPPSGDAGWMGA
jgi:hypothetical protein